jgi:excisionase family DNA binding protein
LLVAAAESKDPLMEALREVTERQAARMLNVSHQTVVRLIDDGAFTSRIEGPRRRIQLASLLRFRDEMIVQRRAALHQMTTDAEALGLYL